MTDRKVTVTSDRDPTDRNILDPTLEANSHARGADMTADVMAELERWLDTREWEHARGTEALLRRARDEIVALRARLDVLRQWKWSEATDLDIRNDALEEAAQACVGSGAIVREARLCASAIRALKGKQL